MTAIVACVLLALLVGYAISTLLQLQRTLMRVSKFLDTTGEAANTVMAETTATLRSIRQVTDNANAVTQDVRQLSSSLNDVADDVRRITFAVRQFGAGLGTKLSGFMAGYTAAMGVLKTILSSKKGGSNE